jgi:RNA polymerase sigma-70 factor (ECF subfamily)
MTPDRTTPDDAALLRDFVAGRRDALGELARRHEPALLGLACGLLGGRQVLACDAIQEMWVRVIRFARGFGGQSSVKTWLYRVLINQCRALRETERLTGWPQVADESESRRQSDPAGPATDIDRTDSSIRLRRQVEQLDSDKRVVLLLCYHEGLTHEQAAEILGLPLGTLKSRLHAALTELRAALGAREAI